SLSGKVSVSLVSPNGNRIQFVGSSGVSSLEIDVLPNTSTNGAITDLGFKGGAGSPVKSSAGGAFIDNASVSAKLTIAAPTVNASASLGFIGIAATGSASLIADASLSLVNPADGATKAYLTDIATAFAAGKFLHTGNNTGPISGDINGDGALELSVHPTGAISSISGL